MYRLIVHPFLLRHEERIDEGISQVLHVYLVHGATVKPPIKDTKKEQNTPLYNTITTTSQSGWSQN